MHVIHYMFTTYKPCQADLQLVTFHEKELTTT